MNKDQIDTAIAALRDVTFQKMEDDDKYPPSKAEERAKQSFDAVMILVRDGLVCLNIIAGRLK